MKKILIMLLCILLLLTGCAKAEKLSGRIAHIYGATLLIAGEDGELYTVSVGQADTGGSKLFAGQYVEIVYSEGIMETYPAQLGGAEEIRISQDEPASDLIEVFAGMIAEVLEKNVQPTNMLAYDFSQTEMLTEAEQQAVGYLCWTELDAEPAFGTREELLEQNIILESESDKKQYIPEGWLLTFFHDEEDASLLHVELWRNDALREEYIYLFTDDEGEWHYTQIE